MKTTRNREAKRKPDEAELSSALAVGVYNSGHRGGSWLFNHRQHSILSYKKNYENNRQQERQCITDTDK